MTKYTEATLNKMRLNGESAVKIAEKAKQMTIDNDAYNNSVRVRTAYTYVEILPLGTVITLIAALALKRKPKTDEVKASIIEDWLHISAVLPTNLKERFGDLT